MLPIVWEVRFTLKNKFKKVESGIFNLNFHYLFIFIPLKSDRDQFLTLYFFGNFYCSWSCVSEWVWVNQLSAVRGQLSPTLTILHILRIKTANFLLKTCHYFLGWHCQKRKTIRAKKLLEHILWWHAIIIVNWIFLAYGNLFFISSHNSVTSVLNIINWLW